jgi:hypothetical protein
MRQAGPHAMRLLWLASERLPSALIRLFVRLSMRAIAASSEADVAKLLVRSAAQLGAADQRLLEDPVARRLFAQAVVESYRQGPRGNLEGAMMLLRPWGFDLQEVTFEKLFLRHGEQDRLMPVAPARLLARALPHCAATF